nr:heavy metal translocating P-type ATPase [Ignatzschineria indica]
MSEKENLLNKMVTKEAAKEAIKESSERTFLHLAITGMTCANCSGRIERVLGRKQGIYRANVNLASKRGLFEYNPTQITPEAIIAQIEKTGFGAMLDDKAHQAELQVAEAKAANRMRWELVISALFSAPMLLGMMAMMLGSEASWVHFVHLPWVQLLLTTPIQFGIGARFYRAAWASLRAKAPSMDLLVAMGTTAAYLYSLYNGFLGGDPTHLYFESSAVIITLILLGKYFEERAKNRTGAAIRSLMSLQAETALRIERSQTGESGQIGQMGQMGQHYIEVPIDAVVEGDDLLVHPGKSIPVDGVVLSGYSTVDESMLTGESLPVDKGENDLLYSGTLNQSGALVMKALKRADESTLSKIITLVNEAQGSKAPIQQLADRVSAIFVPAVILIAFITLLVTRLVLGEWSDAIMHSVAVLVIACPCALGLATPTAIMVGTGVGARQGILIKNGEALERVAKSSTIVLDKTGTITAGAPEVKHFAVNSQLIVSEAQRSEILRYLVALESHSEHPLAKAIVAYGAGQGQELSLSSGSNSASFQVKDFQALVGAGLMGIIAEERYFVGSPRLMGERHIDLTPFASLIDRHESRGETVVLMSREQDLVALVAIADPVKESSAGAIAALKARGIKVLMLTGDNQRTAEKIGEEVGLCPDEIRAELKPEDKAKIVADLQTAGESVAMVGDGMNDAPALALADTGIAMGTGTDIAMESSDVTIMNGDLASLPKVIKLSEMTMRKIRQNLFWAFIYNVIGIPFAALGFLSPILAGGAMAFSSVSVLLNSLSLNRLNLDRLGKDKK